MDITQTVAGTVILADVEASLYLQATTTAVWVLCDQTPIARVHPNRDKVSFYGTLYLHSAQEVATQELTMNGEGTARHLQRVLDTYPEAPLLLLWDRAGWLGGPWPSDLSNTCLQPRSPIRCWKSTTYGRICALHS